MQTYKLSNLVLALNLLLAASANVAARPNILFMMTDDHAVRALSAYDSSLIQTPNMDRIAKEGALFGEHSSPIPFAPLLVQPF